MLKLNNSSIITPDGSTLLKGINFEIKAGELAYLHGPNGVGKTSLIKAILGVELKIDNLECHFNSYFYLPQIENKEFILPIHLSDISKQGPFLKELERKNAWNKASGGQRKKTLLERVVVENCDIYFLDEPYNHLDLETIFMVNQKLEELLKCGKSIFMISHKRPEVSEHLIIELDASRWK